MRTTICAHLVGMRFHDESPQSARSLLRGNPILKREPDNPHDANAVAVVVGLAVLGHIERRSAAILAPMLDSGATYEVQIDPTRTHTSSSIPLRIHIAQNIESVVIPNICAARTIGIYAILVDCAKYVGQSIDVQSRIATHWDELRRGIHQNSHLRQLWATNGSAKFSVKLLEVAPKIVREIDLARWLHTRECHWVETFGGLRNVINAEYPRPVLSEVAKHQLHKERQSATVNLTAMYKRSEQLHALAINASSSIEFHKMRIKKAAKFWGLFNSAQTESDSADAQTKISKLQNAITDLNKEQSELQENLIVLKAHLFL